jgi:hypothetical protein
MAGTLETLSGRLVIDDLGALVWLGLTSDQSLLAGDGSGLWEITLQLPSTPSYRGTREVVTAAANKPRCEALPTGMRLHYPKLAGRARTWHIQLTVDIEVVDDAFSFRMSINNGDPDWVVQELRAPILAGSSAADDMHLLWPAAAGQRLSLRNAQLRRLSYPGAASMQWFAVTTGDGYGLYIGSHDTSLQATPLQVDMDSDQRRLELAISKFPLCGPGESWRSAPFFVAPFRGSWHAAARRYRAWADSWFRPVRRPGWVAESSGWQLSILKQQNGEIMWRYGDISTLGDLARQAGLNTLGLFGWAAGGHDHHYPVYEPDPLMGGEQLLRQEIVKAKGAGFHTILYANGHFIDANTDYYRKSGQQVCYMGERGEPLIESLWRKYLDAWPVAAASACPGSPDWVDLMVRLAERAHDLGATGILYDQLGLLAPVPCFNENHGHEHPYCASGQGRAALLKRVQEHMHEIDPDFAIMTEGVTDALCQYADYVHGCGQGFQPNPGAFPEMIRYTFPEFIMTQRHPTPALDRSAANFACQYGLRHEVEFRYTPDVNYVLRGEVPHRRSYIDIPSLPNVSIMRSTTAEAAAEYVMQLVSFERRHADLLWNGRFVDTEHFTLDSECITGKAYRANGQLGVLLRNESGQPQHVRVAVEGWRLTGAFDINGAVDPGQPLPAQSVRLVRYSEEQ